MIKKRKYKSLALGGTFDHFHTGHRDFISFAANLADQIIIGVTDEKMILGKRLSDQIQPLFQRKQAVSQFCAENKIKATIITIHDPYGPTIEDTRIQAIACTTDTVIGAEKINEIRTSMHLRELPIHIHNLVLDQEKHGPISSYRIRAGEINRDGLVYANAIIEEKELTQEMRSFFASPHGKILENKPQHDANTVKIIVGDSSLEKFINNKWQYNLGIFDYKQKRKITNNQTIKKIADFQTVKNKPGYISLESVKVLAKWFSKPDSFQHLFVDGEEDLLAVVAILLAPLGSNIYYGQPNVGIVQARVTEQIKQQFLETLYPNLSRK